MSGKTNEQIDADLAAAIAVIPIPTVGPLGLLVQSIEAGPFTAVVGTLHVIPGPLSPTLPPVSGTSAGDMIGLWFTGSLVDGAVSVSATAASPEIREMVSNTLTATISVPVGRTLLYAISTGTEWRVVGDPWSQLLQGGTNKFLGTDGSGKPILLDQSTFVSPAADVTFDSISALENNYSGGVGDNNTHGLIIITSLAGQNRNIRGLTVPVSPRHKTLTIHNRDPTNYVVLEDEDTSAAVTRRIRTPGRDGTDGISLKWHHLMPGCSATLYYDTSISRWLVIGVGDLSHRREGSSSDAGIASVPTVEPATKTTRNGYNVVRFADAATNRARFLIDVPPSYRRKGLILSVHWTAQTVNSGNLRWQARRLRDGATDPEQNLDADAADGTLLTATSAFVSGASGDINSSQLVFTDGQVSNPAPSEPILIEIIRLGADVLDTIGEAVDVARIRIFESL